MALTKTVTAVDEWEEVGQNAVREGATIDVSSNYETVLHIIAALSTETAHTGTKIEIQVSSNTSGDEDWSTLVSFLTDSGTANSETINDNPLTSGSTTIAVTSTTGFLADEVRFIFIEDGTVANSEIALLVSHVADTSITIQDPTTNEHANTVNMFNIVNTFNIEIPSAVSRCRVIYDNTFDSNGSTIHTMCRRSNITGI